MFTETEKYRSYPVPAAAKKEFAKVENDLFSPPAAAPAPVLVRAVLCLSLLLRRVDRLRCAGPMCESYKIAHYMTPYLKKFEFYKISPLSKSVKHQKDKVTI